MKKLYFTILSMIYSLPVYASTIDRTDNSGLFVYIFLAFCALIVVLQLVPAIMMMFGFGKSFRKEKNLPKAV